MHWKAFLRRWPENKTSKRNKPGEKHTIEDPLQRTGAACAELYSDSLWACECRGSWHMMRWGRKARLEDKQSKRPVRPRGCAYPWDKGRGCSGVVQLHGCLHKIILVLG